MESSALIERLLAQQKDLMKQQRDEAKADMAAMEAKLNAKEVKMEALRAELTPPTPTAAITEEQLASLQSRLEALHTSKLLSDEELFSLEDSIIDWVSLQQHALSLPRLLCN